MKRPINAELFESTFKGRLAETTRTSYDRSVELHQEAGYDVSYEGLMDRVLTQEDFHSAAFELCVNAVSSLLDSQQHQKNAPEPLTLDQKNTLRKLNASRQAECNERHKRGAIDEEKLDELLEYIDDNMPNSASMMLEVLIAWGTACRTSEAATLARKHFQYNETDGWFTLRIKIHDPKRYGAHRRGRAVMEKRLVHPRVQRILGRPGTAGCRLDDMHPNEYICPYWRSHKMLEVIKCASTTYRWDPDLQWVVHSLRHGVGTAVRATSLSRSEARKYLGHAMVEKVSHCTRTYTASNEERKKGAVKRSARRAHEQHAKTKALRQKHQRKKAKRA